MTAMQRNKGAGVSPRERKVLAVLAQHYSSDMNCLYFRYIASETGLEVKQVRRSVRSLARKGLAEYVKGLFNNDGEVAGSGYCCTREGRAVFDVLAVEAA